MTPTAIDAQVLAPPTAIVPQAAPDHWTERERKQTLRDRSFFQAFVAVQKFRTPSSMIQFAELSTAELPTADDVIQAVLSKYSAAAFAEEASSWDVVIELPAWKGPKGIRVQALVKKVSRGTFRPITEDEIGGT